METKSLNKIIYELKYIKQELHGLKESHSMIQKQCEVMQNQQVEILVEIEELKAMIEWVEEQT